MDQGEINPSFVKESNIYDPELPSYSEINEEPKIPIEKNREERNIYEYFKNVRL